MDAQSTDQPVYSIAEGERETLQRLPASIVGSRPSAWDIYRFELVYFDPEFQRWQLFQEKASVKSEKGHRRHIQAVLNSLRRAFGAVPRGTRFGVKSDNDQTAPIAITRAQWNKLSQGWNDASLKAAELWPKFIDSLRVNARKDGLLDAQSAWTDRFREMEHWPEVLATEDRVALTLDSAEARDLISLLPILPHWDLYGAIREAWAPTQLAAAGREPLVSIRDSLTSRMPDAIQPSLWQDLGRLRQPFYCTRLVYLQNGTDDQHLRSKQLLGYSVATEAVFTDLSHPDSNPRRIALRDTFEYAYLPTGIERAHYSFYALLLDALQLALMGEAQTQARPDPARDDQPKAEELYYFAYPIFSGLGRRHFLHVYAAPHSGQASLDTLWSDWRELHSQLDWEQLRGVLVDELEQVDLARFQTQMNREMIRYSESAKHAGGTAIIEPSVAEQSHLLFPVHCACSGARKWTFRRDSNVSFRQACESRSGSGFLLFQQPPDRGSADFQPPGDFRFADS